MSGTSASIRRMNDLEEQLHDLDWLRSLKPHRARTIRPEPERMVRKTRSLEHRIIQFISTAEN